MINFIFVSLSFPTPGANSQGRAMYSPRIVEIAKNESIELVFWLQVIFLLLNWWELFNTKNQKNFLTPQVDFFLKIEKDSIV